MINLRRSLVLLGFSLSGWLLGCHSGISTLPQSAKPIALTSSSPVNQARSSATMSTIAFESLAQGESYTAGLENPTLLAASNAAEAANIIRLLNNDDATKRIQAVDFNTTYLVAVFRGQVESSGYGVTIQQISTAARTVKLTVNLTDPPPNRMRSTVIGYPYHIVSVPREKLRLESGATWSVQTQEGKPLVQINYP